MFGDNHHTHRVGMLERGDQLTSGQGMDLYKSLISCKYSVLRTAAKSPRKPLLFVTVFSGGKLIFTCFSKTDKS